MSPPLEEESTVSTLAPCSTPSSAVIKNPYLDTYITDWANFYGGYMGTEGVCLVHRRLGSPYYWIGTG